MYNNIFNEFERSLMFYIADPVYFNNYIILTQ
jgi:hypothetical protein